MKVQFSALKFFFYRSRTRLTVHLDNWESVSGRPSRLSHGRFSHIFYLMRSLLKGGQGNSESTWATKTSEGDWREE